MELHQIKTIVESILHTVILLLCIYLFLLQSCPDLLKWYSSTGVLYINMFYFFQIDCPFYGIKREFIW